MYSAFWALLREHRTALPGQKWLRGRVSTRYVEFAMPMQGEAHTCTQPKGADCFTHTCKE
jgi:hypothetical protein